MPLILAFCFGAVIGSFLNVVSLRFNTGAGLGGRSKCMACGKKLAWPELVPIASFLFQKGKCRKCKARISWQYPTLEFLAGAAFVLILYKFPPNSSAHAAAAAMYLVETCLLMVIAAYDWKHKIIPDGFVYAFGAAALAGTFVGGPSLVHWPHLWTLAAGPVLAAPFALVWLLSNGRWIGLGDAKLTLGIGWLLGLNGGANAVIWAVWIGAAFSLAWMFVAYGRFKTRTEVPLGPYLILGLYLVLLFGWQAVDFRALAAVFSQIR